MYSYWSGEVLNDNLSFKMHAMISFWKFHLFDSGGKWRNLFLLLPIPLTTSPSAILLSPYLSDLNMVLKSFDT